MGHIYIGYSRKDRDVVRQYIDRLRAEGREVWVDTEDIPTGAEWRTGIERAIDEADVYILFYSPEAAESRWLQDEISYALMKRKPLIPVLLRPTQLPPMLASFQYIDAMQDIEAALRQIFLALDATVASAPRQRQASPVAAPTLAPAPALARSGVSWAIILAVVVLLAVVIMAGIFIAGSPISTLPPTKTATPELDTMQLSATALVLAVTETAAARPTDMPTATLTPSDTPLPTKTPDPQLAFTQTAQALTPSVTLSGVSVNDVQQTATTLAQTVIATRLTVTSQSIGGSDSQTPPSGTNDKLGLDRLVGTLVAEALSTEIARGAASTPLFAASAAAETVIAIRATDDAVLSPREAAILFRGSQNNLLLVGMVSAMGVGLAALALTLILIGRGTRLPRRTAHSGSTSPGVPAISAATPEPLLQEYQIFISSSDKDREWIKVFVDDLQALGYLVWWYAKDAPGLPFGAEIRSAIYYTKVFVVIASPDSMKSKHVEEEVRWAEIYDRPIINVIYRETPVEDWLYGLAKGAAIAFNNEREYKGAMEQLTQAIDHLLQKRLAQVSGGAHPPGENS